MSIALSLSFILIVFAYLLRVAYKRKSTFRSPPGPPALPILGNAHQVPAKQPWVQFAEWGKVYGDVIFLKVFSRQLIILNSRKAASDLFEKRSAIYSERPRRPMAELCGLGKALLFHGYGDVVRQTRKIMYAQIGSRGAGNYQSLQEEEVHQFIQRIVACPKNLLPNTRRLASSVILKISHGYQVTGEDDFLMNLAEQVMSYVTVVISPNRFLVDALPILRYVPAWFPGAGFQREAKKCRRLVNRLMTEPFNMVQQRMEAGTAVPSLVLNNIESRKEGLTAEEADILMWTAGGMYAGGSDTTVALISSFFLAMILHPRVQQRAQAELDSVTGSVRLPTFSDREALPYIDCILKEVLRWQPVAPLAAHSTLVDDTYRGHLIPAGSVVMANAWAFTHDEDLYPEPMTFSPERFLQATSDEAEQFLDPHATVFGFGRRSCPGLHLADGLLWITIATTLATLNVLPELDDSGVEVLPSVEYTTGAVSLKIFNVVFFRDLQALLLSYRTPLKIDIRGHSRMLHTIFEGFPPVFYVGYTVSEPSLQNLNGCYDSSESEGKL